MTPSEACSSGTHRRPPDSCSLSPTDTAATFKCETLAIKSPSPTTASLHNLDLDQVRPHIPAAELINAASLADAEAITDISELRYETQKATRRNGSPAYKITVDDLRQVDQHADQAAEQGADYISMRRLAELVGATTFEDFAALGELLAQHRSDRYGRSIYCCQ